RRLSQARGSATARARPGAVSCDPQSAAMTQTRSTTLEQYRRRQAILVCLVSLAFVVGGIALRDRISWYGTAFFAVCLMVGIMSLAGWLPERPAWSSGQLIIDDTGITRTARKLREHVAWTNIARVRILTNDQGPQLEDVFFVIDGKDGTG